MTNFNQITDEINQQLQTLTTSIGEKNAIIEDIQKELPLLLQQLEGLQSLKTQTAELIAEAGSNNINFHHTFELQGIQATTGETTPPVTNAFVQHEVT